MNMYPDIENDEPQRKSRLPKLLVIIAVIAGIIWFFSGSKEEEKKKNPPVPVKVTHVERKDVPYYLTGVGSVESPNSAEIRTRIDGELVAIYFKEGQEVKKGALLAEIDSRAIRADLAKAKAERQRANAELQTAKLDEGRYNNLLKQDAIAKQVVDQQTAKVKQLRATWLSAQAAVDTNEVLLSYTKITSPVSGRVGIRNVNAGNIVKTSDAEGIVKITQVKPINAIFSLSQSELPILQKAMQAENIVVDAMGREDNEIIATGKIQAVDNEVNDSTGTIKIRAVFENTNNELWPGQLIVLRVQAGLKKSAKVVPAKAIQRGKDGNFVYVIKNSKAEIAKVTIDFENSDIAVINDGIGFEDEVVIDGQSRLKPGSIVKLQEVKKTNGKK